MNQEWVLTLRDSWSQITVLLGAAGVIIKMFIDWRVKKQEIKFHYLQQNKKSEVKEFYRHFLEFENKLKQYLFRAAQSQEVGWEFREELAKSWNRFNLNFYHVRLFLSDKELAVIDEIKSELDEVHLQIDYLIIDKTFGVTDKELLLALRRIRDDVFPKKIPLLMKTIEQSLRKDYGTV